MMPDTDWADAAAMLRALLTDDDAASERLAEAEGRSAADAFALLMAVAFVIALRRHFRDGYSTADVIRLAAQVRSVSVDAAQTVDPVGAETAIKTALGEPCNPDAEADDMTKGVTQVLTLMILVADRDLTSEELDGFIADALAEARKASLPGPPSS